MVKGTIHSLSACVFITFPYFIPSRQKPKLRMLGYLQVVRICETHVPRWRHLKHHLGWPKDQYLTSLIKKATYYKNCQYRLKNNQNCSKTFICAQLGRFGWFWTILKIPKLSILWCFCNATPYNVVIGTRHSPFNCFLLTF